jgi:DNA-binding transcriptional MerR regulator
MLLFMQTAAMQIGELAKRTALTVDAIRFYERRQLLPKAARSTGGFRLYTTDDIERLHFIRQMHELGFSLREIGELIDLRTRKIAANQ